WLVFPPHAKIQCQVLRRFKVVLNEQRPVLATLSRADRIGVACAVDNPEQVTGEGVAGQISRKRFVRNCRRARVEGESWECSLALVVMVTPVIEAGLQEVTAGGITESIDQAETDSRRGTAGARCADAVQRNEWTAPPINSWESFARHRQVFDTQN